MLSEIAQMNGTVQQRSLRRPGDDVDGHDCGTRRFQPQHRILLAERLPEGGLVGFAEVLLQDRPAPAGHRDGGELVRLYVQPQAQRTAIGRSLLDAAEQAVLAAGLHALWLTAWEENATALAFYARRGYRDVGATVYRFEGRDYGNRVLARTLASAGS